MIQRDVKLYTPQKEWHVGLLKDGLKEPIWRGIHQIIGGEVTMRGVARTTSFDVGGSFFEG
jgi:hypothetical protein